MSTRGAIGFRQNGKDKVTYNHSDSYPSYLGVEVLNFAREAFTTTVNKQFLVSKVANIRLVKEGSKPSKKDIGKFAECANLGVGSQSFDDWYCLLRGAQGDLSAYLNLGVMVNSSSFLKDSLFCEWAYIINLDDNLLEVYKGFNTDKKAPGRYSKFIRKEFNDNGYRGVRLIAAFPLDNLPDENTFLNTIGKEE